MNGSGVDPAQPEAQRARFAPWILPVLLVFLAISVGQSLGRLVWGDELFTLYIAHPAGQGAGLRSIWRALAAGADPNPPLIHSLVLFSTALFGTNPLAIRLPSILFVLLALLSMAWILSRRVTPACAAAGLLAFMATRGFDYSYDARSYAPMMGLAMLSLALWLEAAATRDLRRNAAVAGMALALAAGLFTNYYCCLAFFPIAIGEATRAWQTRLLRPAVWIGLAVASLPLVVLLPLIRHNIAEFVPHAWNRVHPDMLLWSYLELVEGIFWPVLAMALYLLWRRRRLNLPTPESAALLTLVLYPFLGFAIAIAGAGIISPRCVAPVCCGFGLAAGLLTQRLFGLNPRATRVAVAILLVWVVTRESLCALALRTQRRNFLALRHQAAQLPLQDRILVGDSSFVLPFYFYSAPDVQRRIVFPVDFDRIHRLEPDDSGEENLWAGRNLVFPFPIVPYAGLDLTHPTVLAARPEGWLARSVRADGHSLTPIGDPAPWEQVGGVFSPMAHPTSRFLAVGP